MFLFVCITEQRNVANVTLYVDKVSLKFVKLRSKPNSQERGKTTDYSRKN